MRPRSIRARTTLVATLAASLTLVAVSLFLLWTLQHSLTANRDQAARTSVRELAADLSTARLPDPVPVGEDAMAQVVSADGRVLAASVNLGDTGPVSDLSPPEGELVLEVRSGVPDDTDIETFRIWATTTQTPDGPVRIYVGTGPERVTEAARALQGGLLVGVPTVVAALAAVTSLLVGRSLRPVERIRAEVAEISTGEPARRVPVPATGDEIQRLGDTMNQMLERLADGHRREREFVGDVSHELLSPLASLRTQLEVAAATPDTTEWPELVRDLGDEVLGMERLVQDLLFLAREDAGAAPVPIDLVDLDDLVLQEVRRLRPPAGITVDTSDVSAAPVRGVPDDLGRLVRNLLENAAKHARSRVTAGLRLADGRAVLTVADDGPGIPSDLRERVFERFVRGGSARERRDGAGAGLGLPIARAIAVRHGGTLEPDETASGTRMRASLPAG